MNNLNKNVLESMNQFPSFSLTSTDDELDFKSAGALTLGVEIELQLIDQENYNLNPCAEAVLNTSTHLPKIKPEFFLSTLETNSDKCKLVQEAESDLRNTLSELNFIAQQFGIALSTTGTHPFSK